MNMSAQTKLRITDHQKKGFTIIIGCNPHLDKTKKWAGHDCIRLCLTNSKRHGWTIRTVWAVKPKGETK